jgi:hypothetical protein
LDEQLEQASPDLLRSMVKTFAETATFPIGQTTDLTAKIHLAHQASDGVNGAARILADLRETGEVVSGRTVAKLRREHDIRGISLRPWRPVTTIGDATVHAIPDLTWWVGASTAADLTPCGPPTSNADVGIGCPMPIVGLYADVAYGRTGCRGARTWKSRHSPGVVITLHAHGVSGVEVRDEEMGNSPVVSGSGPAVPCGALAPTVLDECAVACGEGVLAGLGGCSRESGTAP